MSYEWNSHYQTNRSGGGNSYDPNVPYGAQNNPFGGNNNPNVPYGAQNNPFGGSNNPNVPYGAPTAPYGGGFNTPYSGYPNGFDPNMPLHDKLLYQRMNNDPALAGAEIIPLPKNYDQSRAITMLFVIFGLVVLLGGAPSFMIAAISYLHLDTGFWFSPFVMAGCLAAVIARVLVIRALYLRSVRKKCTCRSEAKFLDYDVRIIYKAVGRSGRNRKPIYRKIEVYYPRFLVTCNGKKQIRTLPKYRRMRHSEPDTEVYFNPNGIGMYIPHDKVAIEEIKNRAILYAFFIGAAALIIVPIYLVMFKII